MKRVITAVFFTIPLAAAVIAQEDLGDLTLAGIIAKGANQLSKDELQTLLPNAAVKSVGRGGSTRYWANDPDGTFIASSDTRGKTFTARPSSGRGAWRIDDNGAYCVTIDWRKHTEEWCRFILRLGDNYFGVSSMSDQSANVHELSFSK